MFSFFTPIDIVYQNWVEGLSLGKMLGLFCVLSSKQNFVCSDIFLLIIHNSNGNCNAFFIHFEQYGKYVFTTKICAHLCFQKQFVQLSHVRLYLLVFIFILIFVIYSFLFCLFCSTCINFMEIHSSNYSNIKAALFKNKQSKVRET